MVFIKLALVPLLLISLVGKASIMARPIQSQGRVNGIVIDSASRQPVAFASVSLLAASGNVIDGLTTSESGAFDFADLPYAEYTLRITYLGYYTRTLFPLSLTHQNPVMSLGMLALFSQTQQLGEVVVTAQKAIIEEKSDRLVYNAAEDLTNKGVWQLDDTIQSKVMAMVFAMASEIERGLISKRTRHALLMKKEADVRLGRPKGRVKANLMSTG